MACIATGRPIICSWRWPWTSVQGWSMTTGSSKAAAASSAAIRRMVAAGMPQRSATASGAYSALGVAAGQQLEHRRGMPAVRERDLALQRRLHARPGRLDPSGAAHGDQRPAVGVAGDQPVIGVARCVDHQPGGVGPADQVVEVDPPGVQELVDQAHDEEPVGAGADADPFVGNGRVAGADRVDRDDLRTALLELRHAELQGIAVVVLGDAEDQEVAGVLEIRLAELPEAAADAVEAAGRHVDRAEPAMRGVVAGAELAGPEAGETLALVAAGEEGELPRIGLADLAQPLGGDGPAPPPTRSPGTRRHRARRPASRAWSGVPGTDGA